MKKRDSNEETMKQAIDRLLKAYKLDRKMDEVEVLNSWETMMGPMIAKHTREIFISDRILHIRLNSSVLREELSYAKTKIKDMMNEKAGREIIDDVILK